MVALLFHHALLSDWRPAFYAGELLNTLLCDPPDAPGGFTACLVLNLYASMLEAFVGALTGGGIHYLLVNTFVAYFSSWALFHLLLPLLCHPGLVAAAHDAATDLTGAPPPTPHPRPTTRTLRNPR